MGNKDKELRIKANGLRNELKDLVKATKQTNNHLQVIADALDNISIALMSQVTNEQTNEKQTDCPCSYRKLTGNCQCKNNIEGITISNRDETTSSTTTTAEDWQWIRAEEM